MLVQNYWSYDVKIQLIVLLVFNVDEFNEFMLYTTLCTSVHYLASLTCIIMQVDLLEAVNEFLEIVSYFASRICAANIDICRSSANLLYEQGEDVLQVHDHFVISEFIISSTQ